jgi:hypothetical protein
LTLMLPIGSASADQVTLGFTGLFGGHTAGDQGATLSFDCLDITAKSNVTSDPWAITGGGTAGKVYWGDLGMLGGTATSLPPAPASNYFGLGVLKATDTVADNTTGPITFRETLTFTFAQAQAANNQLYYGSYSSYTDLSFTMLGVNYLASGAGTAPADNVRLFLKVASGEVLSADFNAGALTIFGVNTDGSSWNGAIRWMLNQVNYANEDIVALAIEETYGSASNPNRQFGVGSITYDCAPVPIPGAILLLGAGLMRLGAYMKRKSAT